MSLINYVLSMRKRRIHVFCLGAAKTGTTSIAQIYNRVLRTAHEPEVLETTDLVMNSISTRITEMQCKELIKNRDRRLNLELESSHPLGYLSPFLVEIFPEAKFIITIREPRSWLKSRINFHLNKSPSEWKKYRNFIWSRHHEKYSKEELFLEKSGLYSIDAYLKQYSEQYKMIFESIPKDKLIVVKTDEINNSVDVINKFIGYQGKDVFPIHANKLKDDVGLDNKISSTYIDKKINNHCGWIIDKYF